LQQSHLGLPVVITMIHILDSFITSHFLASHFVIVCT